MMAKKRKTAPPEETLELDIDEIKAALLAVTAEAKQITDDFIQNKASEIKLNSTALRNKATRYIAKEPIKCLSIALMIGLLIGYIFNKS